jgi:hypothetical protein
VVVVAGWGKRSGLAGLNWGTKMTTGALALIRVTWSQTSLAGDCRGDGTDLAEQTLSAQEQCRAGASGPVVDASKARGMGHLPYSTHLPSYPQQLRLPTARDLLRLTHDPCHCPCLGTPNSGATLRLCRLALPRFLTLLTLSSPLCPSGSRGLWIIIISVFTFYFFLLFSLLAMARDRKSSRRMRQIEKKD